MSKKAEEPKETEVEEQTEETPEVEEIEGDEDGDGDKPKTYTRKDLSKIVGKAVRDATEAARKEAEEAARATVKAEKEAADKKARDEKLKEEAKFQELAEQRETELADLTNRNEELRGNLDETKAALERANTALVKHLESVTKDLALPNGVKALLADKDPVAQLEWIAENADSFKGGHDGSTPKPNDGRTGAGITPTPRAKKAEKPSEKDKAAKAVGARSYI